MDFLALIWKPSKTRTLSSFIAFAQWGKLAPKSAPGFSPPAVLLQQQARQSAPYESDVMILSRYVNFTMFGNQFWCDHSRKSSSVSEGFGVRASVNLPSPIDPSPASSGDWLLLLT
jgi:hypothetical protein